MMETWEGPAAARGVLQDSTRHLRVPRARSWRRYAGVQDGYQGLSTGAEPRLPWGITVAGFPKCRQSRATRPAPRRGGATAALSGEFKEAQLYCQAHHHRAGRSAFIGFARCRPAGALSRVGFPRAQ